MRVDQYQVLIVPQGGHRFYIYVGGFCTSEAWHNAQQMYPNAHCLVQGKV